MTKTVAKAASDQGDRTRLREIIRRESLLEGGTFTLASGGTTSLFFDMKKTMLDPEGANLISDAILDVLEGEEVDYVGGIAMGAVPIVSIVVQKSFTRGRPVRGFFVRKDVKDHGTQKLIDGHFADNSKVILFDDVTTTGGSVLIAVNAARQRGCTVDKVITIVDRQEGAQENLAREGIELVALFRRDDFV